MTSLLDDLLAATRARLAAARAALPAEVLEQRLAAQEPPRGFAAALAGARPALIAEITAQLKRSRSGLASLPA